MEGRGNERPRLIESLALVPASRPQDGLCAAGAPSHAALFQSLRHERLAGGLDDAGADHEAPLAQLGVAHATAMFSEVRARV